MNDRAEDIDAVIAVAREYVTAMLDADKPALRRIFHPSAPVIGHWQGSFDFGTIDEFIATSDQAATGDGPFESRIEGIVMAGDTAVVTVGDYSYGCWFTDHLSMVKIGSDWRIVAKVYHVGSRG